MRSCVKRKRPSWWTPEGVLARLQNGQYIGLICKEASEEMANISIPVSVSRLRQEVHDWTETASYGPALSSALKLWRKSGTGEMILSKHWHDEYLQTLHACKGNAKAACEIAGIGYGVVLAVTNPSNACHDPEFTEKFKIAELERVGVMRERYMDLAENGDGKLAVRAQERLIESALPHLHGQTQHLKVSGKVGHEHTHSLSHELAQEVVLASQARVRRLQSGRQDSLPPSPDDESRVIDITPVREEVPV